MNKIKIKIMCIYAVWFAEREIRERHLWLNLIDLNWNFFVLNALIFILDSGLSQPQLVPE